MELRHRVLGLALLCAAGASHGLALGPVSGAAWIGRPLDLVVPVQGAMGEDALSSCFEVEVYHGDSRQEANRVSVTAQVGEQPQVTDVRIASISSVDEPVVTVQVRATCSQKVSRQYVLLADMPREMVAPTVLPDTPAPEPQLARVDPAAIVPAEPGAAGPIPVAAAKAEPTPSAPVARDTGTSAVARPSPVAARKRPAAKTAPTPRRVPTGLARAQAKPAAPKARLVLDSLEMLSDRVASLESATAEALKPDLLTDARKVQTLEADVKALLALAAKNEASLIDLKARLQRAEAERMPNEVVYGLVVLALAALVAWALWSRRQRHTGTWSTVQGRSESAESGPVPLPVPVVRPVTAPSPVEDSAASKAARLQALSAMLDRNGPSSELDVSLIEMSESNFDNLMKSGMPQNAIRVPTPARAARPADAAAPLAHAGLSVDAVFDIRQQAEFFVSLGQTDRAIRVLEGQISAADAPNPLVYLDLLALLHVPSRKTDFRRVREDFNLLFNANAPEFAQFKDEGRGLEAYPEVLSAISALWPDPKVQAVIETCMHRDPWGSSSSQPFDLAAFRDLLFLHALVQTMALLPAAKTEVALGVPASVSANDTASALGEVAQPDILLDDLGANSELDVDLTDTQGAEPVTRPTLPR